jgi:hypothetical protein
MAEFDTFEGFAQALIGTLEAAAAGGARQVTMVDADFESWPLDDRRVIDALTQLVRLPGRRVSLLAENYDELLRHRPRFVSWRRTWGHGVDARKPEESRQRLPCLLLIDRNRAVHVLDRDNWRGMVTDEPAKVHALHDAIDAVLQRGEPAFAQSVLGL